MEAGRTMLCGKSRQRQLVKLLVKFGAAKRRMIVEADFSPDCGVQVKPKQLNSNDEDFCMIPLRHLRGVTSARSIASPPIRASGGYAFAG